MGYDPEALEDSAKNPHKVLCVESGGDDGFSVDSEAESGEEEEEEGGGAGDIYIHDDEEVAGIALLAALRGSSRGSPVVVGTAMNNIIGLDTRGADKMVVPLLLPFILQTQQSAGDQVDGSDVPQQLFTPQPSWPQQPPTQKATHLADHPTG